MASAHVRREPPVRSPRTPTYGQTTSTLIRMRSVPHAIGPSSPAYAGLAGGLAPYLEPRSARQAVAFAS